jgi:hypothetical protein
MANWNENGGDQNGNSGMFWFMLIVGLVGLVGFFLVAAGGG